MEFVRLVSVYAALSNWKFYSRGASCASRGEAVGELILSTVFRGCDPDHCGVSQSIGPFHAETNYRNTFYLSRKGLFFPFLIDCWAQFPASMQWTALRAF